MDWMNSLVDIVETDKQLRTTTSVALQLKHFILEPAKRLEIIGPILIVFDAVDESGDRDARTFLLKAMLADLSALPSNFRILVTSRPESDIEEQLGSNPHVWQKRMEDLPNTAQDIRLYIESQLSSIKKLNVKWPKDEWLDRLVDLAEGLFQWASTMCRFVKGDKKAGIDPVQQITSLFSPEYSARQLPALDKLYLQVLRQTFPTDNPVHAMKFRSVMAPILAAKQPLSVDSLKKLTRLASDDEALEHPIDLILRPLGALLRGVAETSSPVQPLHTSFRDFLRDDERSGEWYVDTSKEHDHFSAACLDTMQTCLRFNICDLETSYLANVDVLHLSSRIRQAIPPHLMYACHFWADHLFSSSLAPEILGQVKLFMTTHFLHWLEAMSLMAAIPNANVALLMLRDISEVRCQQFRSGHALILSTAADGHRNGPFYCRCKQIHQYLFGADCP